MWIALCYITIIGFHYFILVAIIEDHSNNFPEGEESYTTLENIRDFWGLVFVFTFAIVA